MDLLLQVSEKELEEFPEPPVDQIEQDKPDKGSLSETHSSTASHQLQEASTASEAPKVSTASSCSSCKHRYKRLARQPVAFHTFTYRKGQGDQLPTCIPSVLSLQVEPSLQMFSRTLTPEALRYLHLGILIGKSHPHL